MTGETDGQVDARGRPVRTFGWISRWQEDEETTVVFGHNVCGPLPQRYGALGRVIGLDTGCVFGGALSCYRWPEDEFVCIAAVRTYSDDVPVLVDAELVSRSVEVRVVS
jgi:protein phosphatase